MGSLFSHVIQKRLSRQNEDVATDALAYILQSEDAREAMMGLLRQVAPTLPALRFETQEATLTTETTIRPDMVGRAGARKHVFVENKFWAGLTDNQPVSYLKELAGFEQPTVLLVIAPERRAHTLQWELIRRLRDANVAFADPGATPLGVAWLVTIKEGSADGPLLALTSWRTVLALLEQGVGDDRAIQGDIAQLRSLCDAADVDAFIPISAEETSDQRIPALILQLSSLVEAAVAAAVTAEVVSTSGLKPQANWERIGRYVWLGSDHRCWAWLGADFTLWKSEGETPLWLVFYSSNFGRAREVRELAMQRNVRTVAYDGCVAIPLYVPSGLGKADVIKELVEQLRGIASLVGTLPPSTEPQQPPE